MKFRSFAIIVSAIWVVAIAMMGLELQRMIWIFSEPTAAIVNVAAVIVFIGGCGLVSVIGAVLSMMCWESHKGVRDRKDRTVGETSVATVDFKDGKVTFEPDEGVDYMKVGDAEWFRDEETRQRVKEFQLTPEYKELRKKVEENG